MNATWSLTGAFFERQRHFRVETEENATYATPRPWAQQGLSGAKDSRVRARDRKLCSMSVSRRHPTLQPGLRVRTRNREHFKLPAGLAVDTEVEIVRIDTFVAIVRDDAGKDWVVCIDCLAPTAFVCVNGKWVCVED